MKLIFMGTPDFAVPCVDALYKAGHEILLVVTQPDRPRGRGGKVTFSPVKEWAVSHEIPVYQPEKIKDPACFEEIEKYPCDAAVVAAFGQILPKSILEFPKYGCINVHASLLPKYRGAAPIQWSILNGDSYTGVTTMQMGEGLDDGDILLMQETAILPEDTGGSLFDRLAEMGGQLIVETLAKVEAGSITPTPQDSSKATHVGMIQKSMGHLSFDRSAGEIERYIRGLCPWPGTYVHFRGKTLKIHKVAVVPEISDADYEKAMRGSLLVRDERIFVKAKEGALELLELQPEGKKRMSATDYVNGYQPKTGEEFS